MAYEGLSRALIQIANDYGNAAEAERERARIRSEKLADRDDERAYQKSVRDDEEQRAYRMDRERGKISLENRLKELEGLAPAQLRQELLRLATLARVEGDYTTMDNATLVGAIRAKGREDKDSDLIADDKAKARGSLEATRVIDQAPETKATIESLQARRVNLNTQIERAYSEINALTQGKKVTTASELAAEAARKFGEANAKNPKALDDAGMLLPGYDEKASPANKVAFLINNAERWAKNQGMDLEKEAAARNRSDQAGLSMEARVSFAALSNLLEERSKIDSDLTRFRVTPNFGTSGGAAITANSAAAPAASAPARTGPTLGNRVQGVTTPPPAQPASGEALMPPRAGPVPFGPEIAPEDRGSPASGAALVPPPPTRTASISQPPTALGSEKIDYGMPFTSNVQPIQTPKGSSFWQFAGNEAGNAAKYGTAVARDLVYNAGVAFQNSRADEAPPSGMLPRQEAEAWLQQNGVQLDPQTKSQLISQYEMIASSTLPLKQKGAKVRELQQLAIANDFRSKAWAPQQ